MVGTGYHQCKKITQLRHILAPVWKQSIFVVLEEKKTMVL